MVRFCASEGIVCDPLHVVYACVCGVMGVRVMESVMHVDDEGGVHCKINKTRKLAVI